MECAHTDSVRGRCCALLFNAQLLPALQKSSEVKFPRDLQNSREILLRRPNRAEAAPSRARREYCRSITRISIRSAKQHGVERVERIESQFDVHRFMDRHGLMQG